MKGWVFISSVVFLVSYASIRVQAINTPAPFGSSFTSREMPRARIAALRDVALKHPTLFHVENCVLGACDLFASPCPSLTVRFAYGSPEVDIRDESPPEFVTDRVPPTFGFVYRDLDGSGTLSSVSVSPHDSNYIPHITKDEEEQSMLIISRFKGRETALQLKYDSLVDSLIACMSSPELKISP